MKTIQIAVLWAVWLSPAHSSGESNEALLEEFAAASVSDAESLRALKGTDAAQAEAREKEDPLNDLPKGAQGVVGNEANPSLSIILDTAFAYFTEENRYRQGGHALATSGPAVQGAELALSASVDPFFRVDAAFNLYHVELEEAFATTTALPWNLQVRAGKFKSNVGRHNPTHLHTWHFAQHPLANEFLFGAEGMSLPGMELSVLFPLPWYVELSGALQMGEAGSVETALDGEPAFRDFIYPIRLAQFFDLGDDWALQLGLNAVFGPSAAGGEDGNRAVATGGDLLLKWRPIGEGRDGYRFVAWVTEGWYREMETTAGVLRDAGGYSDVIFGIVKRWELAVRGELWRRVDGNDENPVFDRSVYGMNALRGLGSVSFMPSHFSRLRLQYAYERLSGFDDNQFIILQLEVSAGAHGAHKY